MSARRVAAWVQVSAEVMADAISLPTWRYVDGQVVIWDRSTLSDPNPFPTMRLWSRRRAS